MAFDQSDVFGPVVAILGGDDANNELTRPAEMRRLRSHFDVDL